MSSNTTGGRRMAATLAGLIAAVSATLVLAVSDAHVSHAESGHVHADASAVARHGAAKRAALHDAMRKLWEDHVTWTRLAIISLTTDSPDTKATVARLLRNQDDIGDAIKPYYGKKAGAALTRLLRTHITEAVPVLTAAQSGDQAGLEVAIAAWKANARDIADFLAAANPHWSKAEMRMMVATHIDQTVAYAAAQLQGQYARSIRIYGHAEHHMLEMADMLSNGIIARFPGKF